MIYLPQPPSLILSLLLASAYGLAFYLLKGRRPRDLLLLWLASVAGFACGQVIGQRFGLIPWTVGEVHLVEATAVAVIFLVGMTWLKPKGKTS